ncbi:MAG: hypothetical protein R6W06_11825, partial [Prochlorococcaceae cyanobacterium]
AAGATTASLSLPVLADAVIDPGETVILRILPSSSYQIAPGGQFATATIDAEGVSTVLTNDGRLDNPSGAEWRNIYAFAALLSDGSVQSWGLNPFGGSSGDVDLNGPNDDLTVRQIYSNRFAFAALLSDGSVKTWGAGPLGGDSSGIDFNGASDDLKVVAIASTERAFAALLNNGSVVAWGNIGVGGNSAGVDFDGPNNDQQVVEIFANRAAFAATLTDGTVVSWGNPFDGGNSNGVSLSEPVEQIYASERAFAALLIDGSVVTWGNAAYGANSSGVPFKGENGDLKVVTIASSERAFAALRNDGSVLSWGDPAYGGNSAGVRFDAHVNGQGVAALFSNRYAFAALHTDGSVAVWGDGRYGGSLGGLNLDAPTAEQAVVSIAATDAAFAALRANGTVVSWGLASDGGNSSGIDFDGASNDLRVIQITANRSAFAAILSNGNVLTWGNPGVGGNSDGVEFRGPNNTLQVTQIVPTEGAFAALRSDGSVITWGSNIQGGDSSGVDFDGPDNNLKVVGFANPATDDRFTTLPAATNQPPSAIALVDPITSLPENTATTEPIGLARLLISDDGLGSNQISLSGADAAFFKLQGLELVLQAGVALDFESKSSYSVNVEVRDSSLPGSAAVSTSYQLAVLNLEEGPGNLGPISGAGVEGAALSAGAISGDPDGLAPDPNFSWQWFRDGALIPEATGTSFTPSATGAGEYTVEVGYTDTAGSRTRLTSAPLAVAAINNGDADYEISGDLLVGGTARLERIAEDPDGAGNSADPEVAWETSADGQTWEPIANSSSLVIGAEAAGKQLRARVGYRDGQSYASEVLTAAVTIEPLTAPEPPHPPQPQPSPEPPCSCDSVTGEPPAPIPPATTTLLLPPPFNPGHPGYKGVSNAKGLATGLPKGLAKKLGEGQTQPLLAAAAIHLVQPPWLEPLGWAGNSNTSCNALGLPHHMV